MKARRVHVAFPVGERLELKKAYRRRDREKLLASKLASSQAEAASQRAELAHQRQRHFLEVRSLQQRIEDAEEQLRDLAEVLPEKFIAVKAALDPNLQIYRLQRTVHMHTPPKPTLYTNGPRPGRFLAPETMCSTTVQAVQAIVDLHYDLMSRKMHATLHVETDGMGAPRVGYVISLEALRDTDPGVLARTITREVRPLFQQELATMQYKMTRGRGWA